MSEDMWISEALSGLGGRGLVSIKRQPGRVDTQTGVQLTSAKTDLVSWKILRSAGKRHSEWRIKLRPRRQGCCQLSDLRLYFHLQFKVCLSPSGSDLEPQ